MNDFAFLNEPVVLRLGWTLVHSLWQGVIIAAALAAMLRLMRSAPASVRYLASCGAMAMLVLGAAATFALIKAPTPAPATRIDAISPSRVSPQSQTRLALPIAPALSTAPAPQPTPTHDAELRWIVFIWAIGVLALSLWHIGGWLWLTRMRRGNRLPRWEPAMLALCARLGIRRAVALIETARIDVPAVIGAFAPAIVVPIGLFSGLSPQQVEAILAHELAHIRRHDYLINLIQSAIETLFFYHPATWWISDQIRRERENCCDDIATKICGDGQVYAAALTALEGHRAGLRIAMAATGGSLIERVRRVLHLPPARQRQNRIHSLAAAALAIALVAAPIACMTPPRSVHADEKKNTSAAAATPAGDKATTQPSLIQPQDLEARIEDYRTGPGDLLSISVTDLVAPGVETVKSVRVSDTGMISLPLIGVVKVAGQTAPEIEKTIAKAYRDANMQQNAQVSVSVTDAKQRTFNILGEIDRPGQYPMTRSEFRLLDALTLGGMHSSKPSAIHVIRAPENGKPARTIDIPGEAIAAGDAKVNIVIRPGDTIVVESAPQKFVKIVIGRETLLYQGKPIDWPELHKMFDQMSDADRRSTVLEIAAASPDITVERFFSVSAQLSDLAKQYHLAYLSQTGIQPTTEPSNAPRADLGDYYISGVKRSGVYTLGARDITLKQALMAAGGTEVPSRVAKVSIIRRENDKEKTFLEDLPVDDLTDGKAADDPYLKPNDMIIVKPESTVAVMELGTLIKQHDALASEVETMKRTVGPNNARLVDLQDRLKELEVRIKKLGGEGWLEESAKPAISTTQPATAPTGAAAPTSTSGLTVGEIAAVDPTMREYVRLLDQYQLRFEQIKKNAGPGMRTYQDAADDIRIQQQRINAYADSYRSRDRWAKPIPLAPAATQPATQPVVDNELQLLKSQRAAQEMNLLILQQRLGGAHPAVRNTHAYLDELDRRIAAMETNHLMSPPPASTPTTGVTMTSTRPS